MLKDINPGSGSSGYKYYFEEYNGKLYFSADDGSNGDEVWVSDGTEVGTVMLKDINPGSGSSGYKYYFEEYKGKLYFDADNGSNGVELWIISNDNIPDDEDNCPNHYNPNQEDTYPPQGNGIGDACDCECDFDCSGGVDATDVTSFLIDFGRSTFFNPCTNADPCNGDFDCNVNVDADDVSMFLEDFGRSQFYNPCPACVVGDWCVY